MTKQKKFASNGIDYYNIEKEKDNREQYIATGLRSSLLAEATPLTHREVESLDSEPREEGEPLDSGAEEETPLGPHNVKRALFTLFNNDNGRRNLAVRLNLADGTNAEFVAAVQQKSNLTNYLKHTGEYKESARDWFVQIRKHCKEKMGVMPQTGKWHLNQKKRGTGLQTIQVEPLCYGSVAYDKESTEYMLFVKMYDLYIKNELMTSESLSEKQRAQGVRGQFLWINPRFDDRQRPKTFAQLRKEQRNGFKPKT